jgi:hypothetical protein
VTREALVWIGEPLTRWGYRVGARLTAPPRFHASYCEYEATIIIAAFQRAPANSLPGHFGSCRS